MIYHRVLADTDPLLPDEMTASTFDWQMRLLHHNFNVLPLSEAIEKLKTGTLPARAACVTFDDGYADNADIALPILQRWSIPTTFFVSTGFLNGGIMWNDKVTESVRQAKGETLDLSAIDLGKYAINNWSERRSALHNIIAAIKYRPIEQRSTLTDTITELAAATLPTNLMMSDALVGSLHQAGMEIGAHTVNHPILAEMDDDTAYQEITNGKNTLEKLIDSPVTLFAYPNGKPQQDYRAQHVAMLEKLGFQAAVSTAMGVATTTTDTYQLPRFTPWDKTPTKFQLRLLHNARRTNSASV